METFVSWLTSMYNQRALGFSYFSPRKTKRISRHVVWLLMCPEMADGDVRCVGGVGNIGVGK